jgi:hypothetical protein
MAGNGADSLIDDVCDEIEDAEVSVIKFVRYDNVGQNCMRTSNIVLPTLLTLQEHIGSATRVHIGSWKLYEAMLYRKIQYK